MLEEHLRWLLTTIEPVREQFLEFIRWHDLCSLIWCYLGHVRLSANVRLSPEDIRILASFKTGFRQATCLFADEE